MINTVILTGQFEDTVILSAEISSDIPGGREREREREMTSLHNKIATNILLSNTSLTMITHKSHRYSNQYTSYQEDLSPSDYQ